MHKFIAAPMVSTLTLSVLLSLPFTQPALAGPFVVEKDHTLVTGTYLGGTGNDQARGVVFNNSGSPIVAGNFPTMQTPGKVRNVGLGATVMQPGKVLRLSADGKVELEMTLGNRIDSMAITPGGNRLVVGGDFGIAMLDPTSLKIYWHQPLTGLAMGDGTSDGGQTRVAIDTSWRAVVLRAGVLQTFEPNGKPIASIKIDRTFVNDVAIDKKTEQVYVLGYSNRKNAGVPVQVPFVYGLDAKTLKEKWRTWDFDAATLGKDMADSRMYRVTIAPTGEPIVLGESAGGNSIYRWNGKDLVTETRIKTDVYSDTYNSKANHMLYYAKLNPATGVVNAGQYVLSRLDDKVPANQARTNTTRAQDGSITTDAKGNIYIGHISAYRIAERDTNTIAGQLVAPYTGDDFVMLMVTPDMKKRTKWTSFGANPGGGGTPNAIAAKDGKVAIFGTVTFGSLITEKAIVPKPFNPEKDAVRDAYLAVMKAY
jgi:hypothetical protein